MSEVCKIVYLDENNKPATSYYNNLHLGHEAAEAAYLNSMAEHVFTKFQKSESNVDSVIKDSKKMKLNKDGSFYKKKNSSQNFDRVTHFLGSFQDEAAFDEIAKDVAIKNRARFIIHSSKDPIKDFNLSIRQVKNGDFNLKNYPEVMETANAWATSNPKAFEEKVQEVKDLWDFKREAGTDIHKLIEDYINDRTKVLAENPEEDLDSVSEKAKVSSINNVADFKNYSPLLDQIEDFLRSISRGKNLRFETEVVLQDDELGVAGTIDLLVFDDEGNAYIYDYKTKEKGKEFLFDISSSNTLTGALSGLVDNKETLGALQTSLYRLILERRGINVKESKILYIEADVKEYGKKKKYENFNIKKEIHLEYLKSNLKKAFIQSKDVDITEYRHIETDKNNYISDVVSNLTGQDSLDKVTDKKKTISRMLANVKKHKASGKEFFINKMTGRRVYYNSDARKAREGQLMDYLNELEKNTAILSRDVMKYFKEGKKDWPKPGDMFFKNNIKDQVNKLLAGIEPETHILSRVNEIPGFEHISDNILLARDKTNDSVSIVNLSSKNNSKVDLGNSDEKRTANTIFGNFITNGALKREYKVEGLEATINNFKHLESAMLIMELKKAKVVDKVYSLRVGPVNGRKDTEPSVTSMSVMMPHVRILNDHLGDTYSKYLSEVFKDKDLLKTSNYNNDYVQDLYNMITLGFRDVKGETLEKLERDLKDYKSNELADADLLGTLIRTQRVLGSSIQGEKKTYTREELSRNKEYRLISQAILQLAEVKFDIGSISRRLGLEAKIRTTSKIGNDAIKTLDSKIKSTEQFINREFKTFQDKHSKLLKELLDEMQVGRVDKASNMDMQEIFKELYQVDPDEDYNSESEVDKLFTLKDPDDLSDNTLGAKDSAKRRYIRFFNKYVRKGFEFGNPTKANGAFEPDEEGVMGWEEGQVPLMIASRENKIAREESLKGKMQLTKENLFKNVKNTQNTFHQLNTHIEDQFGNQIGRAGVQNTDSRRALLGIDVDGDVLSGERPILDTNLEHILNNFMENNLRQAHYETTLGVYNAMNIITFIEQNEHFNSTQEVRDFMAQQVKLIVFNEYNNEEEDITKFIDITNKGMTLAALGFSAKQVVLEGATNLFATSSSMLSQQFIKLFGGNARFQPSDWIQAGKLILGDRTSSAVTGKENLAEAIVRDMGLYKADSEALGSKEFQETKKNSWMQSKWAYALNNTPFKFFKAQTFIAEMRKDGVLEALSAGENNELLYDPSKDKRFEGIFDKDGNLKEMASLDDKHKEKMSFYQSLVKDLELEPAGINENGYPTRPYSSREISAKKDYALSLYGSLDKDARVMAQAGAYGRMFLKFKNWMVAKKDNYITRGHLSEARGERVKILDPDHPDGFYYEFEPQWHEGILQTLQHISMGAYDILKESENKGGDIKDMFLNLSRSQKENLSRLLSDTLIAALMTMLISAAMDTDIGKKGPARMGLNSAMNATADLNILQMTSSMADGNPIATLSYIFRTVGSITDLVVHAGGGEWKDATETGAKMFGSTKSIYSFYED